MGKKVHPVGIRLKIVKDWSSRWYADKRRYKKFLLADIETREYLLKKLRGCAISDITIERLADNVRITIHTARPGAVIGKKGADIEKLRSACAKIIGTPVSIAIEEVRKPETNAKIVAESIAQQLERRVMFRKAIKRAIGNAMRQGVGGIKVMVSGRLNGAEIARTEWQREGRVPLHTFRADIEYGLCEAVTQYGVLGVKVWIFHGEVGGARGVE